MADMSDEELAELNRPADWRKMLAATEFDYTALGRRADRLATTDEIAEVEKLLLAGTLGDDHRMYLSKPMMRRGTVAAIISNALYHVREQHSRDAAIAAAGVLQRSPAEELKRQRAKAAFGKNPTLKAQGDFIRTYGEEEALFIAKEFGAKLGDLSPHKTPSSFKKNIPDPLAEPDKKTAKAAKRDEPDKPSSKNPWKSRNETYSVAELEEQGAYIARMGTVKAAAMARSAGVSIGVRAPNKDFAR